LSQTTDYPFGGQVNLVINASKPFQVPLKIFIPEWTNDFKVTANNVPVSYIMDNGFMKVTMAGESTSSLKIEFELEQKVLHEPKSENDASEVVRFMSGPLLLGYKHNGEEISFTSAPKLLKTTQNNRWKATDGTHEVELTPVYHLLAPEVSKANEYKKQIIF
jgi:DUF1680 family protein